MKLLIVRHAVAEELANPAHGDDAKRELTPSGRRKMRRIAKKLVRLVRIDALVTSPLVRAVQTAEIIATAKSELKIIVSDTLVPGSDPDAFVRWLADIQHRAEASPTERSPAESPPAEGSSAEEGSAEEGSAERGSSEGRPARTGGSARQTKVVAVVGHEPHLSSLATWLLSGHRESRIELKKGGACLLEFDGNVQQGAGRLLWLLTSRQLRRIDV